ncbi:MAG: tyrosine-type recombinase/integrase [Candidatus Kapabacteria bacterium]|nr:tyrosine-type recombinase/integrase [Candidatus Kapabacteria bacterium]
MAQYSRKLAKGVVWYYKFDCHNKTYFSKCIYETKGAAKKAEREHQNLLDAQTKLPVYQDIQLSELVAKRIEYLTAKKSKKYCTENDSYLKRLLLFLGDKFVKDVSKSDINNLLIDYANELKNKNLDNYAVNALLRVVKALFNQGIDILDMHIVNPCRGVRFYSVKKNLKYIPTDADIEALLNVCDQEERLLICFVRDTGARINEAIRLTFNDIIKNDVVLYTRKSYNSDLVPRKVPKPECIKSLITPKDKTERVFSRWSELPRFLEKRLKALNMQVWGYHNLRHRYASLLSKQGKPLFEVSVLLGHSSILTTQRYLQVVV